MRLAERIVWFAFFLAIVVAFSPSIHAQFTLPKLFWLRALGAAVVVAWSVRCWRGEVRALPWSIGVAAGLLLAWWIATTFFAVDVPTALHGMYGRYNGLLTHATLMVIFVVLATTALSRSEIESIVKLMVLSVLPAAVYAVMQQAGMDPLVWPNPRPGSTIGHPVPFAAILSIALPLAAAFAITETDARKRWGWIGIVGLYLFAIAATLSRGPWVGLAIATVVMIFAAFRWRVLAWRANWKPAITFAILIAAVVGAYRLPTIDQATARLTALADLEKDPSFMGRFVFIRAAAAMVRDYPMTGVGFESYALLYPRYRPVEGAFVQSDALPTMVHNGYLHSAVTNGVPAVVLYLAFVGAVAVFVWRGCCASKEQTVPVALAGAAFLAALAGYLVQDLSGWLEISLSAFFWSLLGAAVAYACPEPRRRAGPEPRSAIPEPRRRAAPVTSRKRRDGPTRWQVAGAAIGGAAAASLVVLAYLTLTAIRADRHFFAADFGDVSGGWPSTEGHVTAGLQLTGDDPHYSDLAGVVYLRRLAATSEKSAYDRAAALFDSAAERHPFNPYYFIHRIDLDTAALQRRMITAPSEATRRAVSILTEWDPNNSTVHEALARLALAQGRAAEALSAIRRAKALSPRHARYHALEGDALRMLGDVAGSVDPYRDEAELLQAGTPDWTLVQNKVVLALLETGQLPAAIREARLLVEHAPANVIGHVLLGFANLKSGQVDAAQEAFSAALARDPANASARQGLREVEEQRGAPVSRK